MTEYVPSRSQAYEESENAGTNDSANPTLGEVIATRFNRRDLLRGALAVTAISATVSPIALAVADKAQAQGANTTPSFNFKEVTAGSDEKHYVAEGYDADVLIRWGDPVLPGAPAFDPMKQSAAAQKMQYGYNNDFVGYFPMPGAANPSEHGLLGVNHEYTNEELMFPGLGRQDSKQANFAGMTKELVDIEIAAHGGSVIEVRKTNGKWQVVDGSKFARRITGDTAMEITGPAAGHDRMKTAADPAGKTVLGMLNNCAGGTTPWGTVLSGEENFNQYFVGADQAPAEVKPAFARYGIDVTTRYPSGSRRWERVEERFDLAKNPNEANRFGWIVEIDPYDPESVPRKHTALGRFKHEGATIAVAKDGRVAAYMGDDERFDYLYKFVSDKKFLPGDSAVARRHNLTLLESGTLYVAQLSGDSPAAEIDGTGKLPSDGAFDGTGKWIKLVSGNTSYVPGMTAADVLTFTRLAGDAVGATKMDRPEDVEPSLITGKVYAAMTNNTNRGVGSNPGVDEANPRVANKHGQIFELIEARGDNTAETFTWSLPIVCGDPADASTYFAGYDKTAVSPISCPDNVAFDSVGNLWISTDGNALGSNDGLFATAIEGSERGHLKQFLTVPIGAETCGPFITGDDRSVFVAVQHPGELSGASIEKPASTWPDGDFAKPSVAVAWRLDGGPIGS
jgi:hypothetical protein